MSKEKEQNKFEDGRQEIDLDKINSRVSKSSQHTATKTKSNSSILTPVFLLFICIPLAFVIYFWQFYDPATTAEQAKVEENQVVEIAKNNNGISNEEQALVDDEKESAEQEILSEEERTAATLAAQAAAEKAAKQEADRVAQKIAEEKAAEEAAQQAAIEEERRKAEEEARRQEQLAEEARQKAAAQEAARQKEAVTQQQSTARSHTVQPNETIYRISVNYYGNGDAVERIKAANGLTSNEISVGQTLILP